MTREQPDRSPPAGPDDGDPRAIGHDAAELERFYRAHLAAVEGFVARRADDPHAAADLTAEVFLAAIRSCRRFDPARGGARSWLFGIAVRVIADAERVAARRWRAHAREGGHRPLADDAIERLERQLDAEDAARVVRDSLAGLPTTDRLLLELIAVDGLTTVDAAAALGLTAGAARVRLHRARGRLREDADLGRVAALLGLC